MNRITTQTPNVTTTKRRSPQPHTIAFFSNFLMVLHAAHIREDSRRFPTAMWFHERKRIFAVRVAAAGDLSKGRSVFRGHRYVPSVEAGRRTSEASRRSEGGVRERDCYGAATIFAASPRRSVRCGSNRPFTPDRMPRSR